MTTDLKRRLAVLLALVLGSLVFLAPTIWPAYFVGKDAFFQSWVSKPIVLGLDLKGGVHLVYRVVAKEAVASRLQAKAGLLKDELKNQKIAVRFARAGLEAGTLEIVLLTDRSIEQAKEHVLKQSPDLEFLSDEKGVNGQPRLLFKLKPAVVDKIEADAVEQSIETLRNRVDLFGVAEPLIQRAGSQRIILQMPGVTDVQSVKKAVGKVAKLEFRLLPNSASMDTAVDLPSKGKEGSTVKVEDQALMTGDAVDEARMVILDGQVEVALSMTAEGARIFRKITTDHVGRNLAIILDGVVYSSPVIREPIAGGQATISGGFGVEEAKQLAVVLRAGALPAPLEVLEERTVGPTLGAESIKAGVMAMLMGLAWITVFLMVYYKKSGIVAVASLALNMLLTLGALSAFGATLTLPGLAGLALTIGMAVDANVLIFERIREEIRNGSSRDTAVLAGFGKAWMAILDSNVTTGLSVIILWAVGTGPIRGFATTLGIGVLSTVYCACFAAKIGFELLPLRGRGDRVLSV